MGPEPPPVPPPWDWQIVSALSLIANSQQVGGLRDKLLGIAGQAASGRRRPGGDARRAAARLPGRRVAGSEAVEDLDLRRQGLGDEHALECRRHDVEVVVEGPVRQGDHRDSVVDLALKGPQWRCWLVGCP